MAALDVTTWPVYTVVRHRCSVCKKAKLHEEFNRSANTANGLHSRCRDCSHALPKVPYAKKREQKLLRRFNMSSAEFDERLRFQGGRCAICRTEEPGGPGTWRVDHDHKCCPEERTCGQCVRALLCHLCNAGLGFFKDDSARLREAANYLERAW